MNRNSLARMTKVCKRIFQGRKREVETKERYFIQKLLSPKLAYLSFFYGVLSVAHEQK